MVQKFTGMFGGGRDSRASTQDNAMQRTRLPWHGSPALSAMPCEACAPGGSTYAVCRVAPSAAQQAHAAATFRSYWHVDGSVADSRFILQLKGSHTYLPGTTVGCKRRLVHACSRASLAVLHLPAVPGQGTPYCTQFTDQHLLARHPSRTGCSKKAG